MPSGWKNNDFTAHDPFLQRLIAELRQPRYLPASDKTLLKDYARFAPASSVSQASSPRCEGGTPSHRNHTPTDRRAELAKFDAPAAHLPAKGPGGTAWDAQYRSFLPSDENAVAKGFPTHAEAAQQIKEDAAKDSANLQKHKGWVLFIKHYSQAYRPQDATEALRKLYQDLVEMEFTGSAGATDLPFAGDPRLTIHRDVAYGKTHPDMQRLDVYLVKSTRPTPVLIEIHGGGWRRGSRSRLVYPGDLIKAVLDAGISLVSIDYRLTPEHPFPAQMEDVVRAVQTWADDTPRFGKEGGEMFLKAGQEIVNPAFFQEVDSRLRHINDKGMICGMVLLLDELRRIRPGLLCPPHARGHRRASPQPAQVHPGRPEAQQARRGCRIRLLPAGPGLRWDRRQAPLAHAGFLPTRVLGDRDGWRVFRDGIRNDVLWGPPRGRAVPGGQTQAQGHQVSDLDHLHTFFTSLRWWQLEPHDERVAADGGYAYCLADAGNYAL